MVSELLSLMFLFFLSLLSVHEICMYLSLLFDVGSLLASQGGVSCEKHSIFFWNIEPMTMDKPWALIKAFVLIFIQTRIFLLSYVFQESRRDKNRSSQQVEFLLVSLCLWIFHNERVVWKFRAESIAKLQQEFLNIFRMASVVLRLR